MTTERRTDARGKAIARVTFTDARSDKPAEGQLRDIGRGGMFVATTSPVPLGKRLDFEVTLATGGTIAGMARVVGVRDAAAGDLPAGMGIKFIDVDNDALVDRPARRVEEERSRANRARHRGARAGCGARAEARAEIGAEDGARAAARARSESRSETGGAAARGEVARANGPRHRAAGGDARKRALLAR